MCSTTLLEFGLVKYASARQHSLFKIDHLLGRQMDSQYYYHPLEQERNQHEWDQIIKRQRECFTSAHVNTEEA